MASARSPMVWDGGRVPGRARWRALKESLAAVQTAARERLKQVRWSLRRRQGYPSPETREPERSLDPGVHAWLEVLGVIAAGLGVTLGLRRLGVGIPTNIVLVVVAGVVTIALGRTLTTWGITGGRLTWGSGACEAAMLLGAAGVPALLLTVAQGTATPIPHSLVGATSALALPLIAQEGHVLGYVRSRVRQSLSAPAADATVVAAFALAHLSHGARGTLGVAFLAAMIWQGYLWSRSRERTGSIIPQLTAHGAILVLYAWPLPGAAIAFAAGTAGFMWSGRRG